MSTTLQTRRDRFLYVPLKNALTHPFQTLAFFYAVCAVALALWGALYSLCTYAALAGNVYQDTDLTYTAFEMVDVEVVDENTLITITDDTQLHLASAEPIVNLTFQYESSCPPGELVLFYASDVNAAFSTQKMIHARLEDGYYTFEMPLNTHRIRFDLGVNPSNTITFESLTINNTSARFINRFTPLHLFVLLCLPLCAFAVLLILQEGIEAYECVRRH